MNATRTLWLSHALADERLDQRAKTTAEALTVAVTGVSMTAFTDARRLAQRTGLTRLQVFDAIEDLVEAGHVAGWKNGTGYKLQMPG